VQAHLQAQPLRQAGREAPHTTKVKPKATASRGSKPASRR
jgi:hypothetical protein